MFRGSWWGEAWFMGWLSGYLTIVLICLFISRIPKKSILAKKNPPDSTRLNYRWFPAKFPWKPKKISIISTVRENPWTVQELFLRKIHSLRWLGWSFLWEGFRDFTAQSPAPRLKNVWKALETVVWCPVYPVSKHKWMMNGSNLPCWGAMNIHLPADASCWRGHHESPHIQRSASMKCWRI